MDAIEGRRDGGKLEMETCGHEGERGGHEGEGKGEGKVKKDHLNLDRLASLLSLVRKESATWEDRGGNEFDGIRSEVDFRRAMELEEERLRGTWSQRLLRALSAASVTFWKSWALRLLR